MSALTLPQSSLPPEQLESLLWSIGGHLLLVGLILLGGIVVHRPPPLVELGIKATVVDGKAYARRREPDPAVLRQQALQEQARAAEKEQQRQKQEEQQAEQRRELEQKQEQQRAEVLQKREVAEKARQADEKRKADKAAADSKAAEKKAAEDKQRQEALKQQAEADAKAASEKRRRQEALDLRRQMAEEEQLLAATNSGALAQYVAVIRQKVERNWVRPPGAKAGIECEVFVTQIPGGQVTGVRMGTCNADEAVRRSIEAAVLRASPLPAPDNAALFERNLRFVFKPEQ